MADSASENVSTQWEITLNVWEYRGNAIKTFQCETSSLYNQFGQPIKKSELEDKKYSNLKFVQKHIEFTLNGRAHTDAALCNCYFMHFMIIKGCNAG